MKDKMKMYAAMFRAFGDQKRLMIIKILASNMEETLCVSDVAKKLNITQPAASQHIKVLKSIDLLNENRKGYRVFYTINIEVFKEYKKEIDKIFLDAFTKCPYDLNCDKCKCNTCYE